MDSGLRDARRGTIHVIAMRHCEARSGLGHDLTDKSTIIWWNGRIILLYFEKLRQLAEQKSANSPNGNM